MARFVFGYRCPECAGKFVWEQSKEPPERCPLCHAWVSEDEPTVFQPKAPAIRKSAYTKSVDQTYRAMESRSIERAEDAASMLERKYAAQPKDEYDGLVRQTQKEQVERLRSELKLTNMKDPSQMREGDTAYIGPRLADPSSAVVRGASFQGLAGGSVPDAAPGVGGGRTGLDAVRNATRATHSATARAIVSRPLAPPYRAS